MGVNIPDIKKQPIVIVSPDKSAAQIVASYFPQHEGVLPKNISIITDNKKSIASAFKHGNKYSLIFIDITLKSTPCDELYSIILEQSNGPIVIITEPNNPTEKKLRKLGSPYFLNKNILSEDTLQGVFLNAYQSFLLQESLRRAEEKAEDLEQRFDDISDSFSDWIWEIDTDMIVKYVSKSRSKTGLTIQKGVVFTSCFLPEDRKKIKEDFKKLFAHQEPFKSFEYWGLDQKGLRVCWSVSGVPTYDRNNEFIGYRGVARDISAEKSSQDQLYYMANNDTLTGLYNRGRFYDELGRAVRDMRRSKHKGAVMLLDLDRFKYVNDTYGHDAGDSMLVHVGYILREVISDEYIISRLGGDEFAIIFTDIKEADVTDVAAEVLERMGASPFVHANHEIALTASVGIVIFPDQGAASGELLSKADIAMYRAKADGRNRWYIFDETHVRDHGIAKRLDIADFIVRCLDEDRIMLYFQPIVPLQVKKRTIKHYEVLCRMLDENGKIVMPIHFIETAEDFGIIQRLDEYICRKSLDFLVKHHTVGHDLSLAVNLSGITFDDEESMARIRALVQHANLPEGRVIFEITETTALKDIGRAQRTIHALKKIGCKIALDDFGVGYSSFNYVRQLDIDYVKIDGSFIRQIHQNDEDRVFVKAINDIAKGLNIKTIAEMVEDEDVEQHIKDLGIDYGQGYHFGRPQPELVDENNI